MTTQSKILAFLQKYPYIPLRGLEKKCGLPLTKFTQVRNGLQNFSPEQEQAIIEELRAMKEDIEEVLRVTFTPLKPGDTIQPGDVVWNPDVAEWQDMNPKLAGLVINENLRHIFGRRDK